MAGFVGSRARKRRRNIALSLFFGVIIIMIIIIIPTLENNNNDIIPDDNIVPNPSVDSTSLTSNIEELQLKLFQKDQKIKFRDGQITNLQNELKKIKSEYDSVLVELSAIQDDLKLSLSNNENVVNSEKYSSLQNKFDNLKIENNKNIIKNNNLNKKIDELNANLQLINDKTNDQVNKNRELKKNNKIIFASNIKLENFITELKQKIIEQRIEINSSLEEIKKLKDRSLHGG